MTSRWLAAWILLVATPAYADGQPIEVELGKTVEVEVGFSRGLICDDLAVVGAELHNKTAQNNVLVLTGKAIGETMCRVGTNAYQGHFLFDVHVVAPNPKR